jgi:hypothetical protein
MGDIAHPYLASDINAQQVKRKVKSFGHGKPNCPLRVKGGYGVDKWKNSVAV